MGIYRNILEIIAERRTTINDCWNEYAKKEKGIKNGTFEKETKKSLITDNLLDKNYR